METHFPDMSEAHGRLARERVMADLKALAGDAEALLRATASDASDQVKETRVRLSAALERAKTTCSELQSQGLDSAKQAAKKSRRNHPRTSLRVARRRLRRGLCRAGRRRGCRRRPARAPLARGRGPGGIFGLARTPPLNRGQRFSS